VLIRDVPGTGTGLITRTRTRLHGEPIKLKIHRVTPGTIWAKMSRKRLGSRKKQDGGSEDKVGVYDYVLLLSFCVVVASNKCSLGTICSSILHGSADKIGLFRIVLKENNR